MMLKQCFCPYDERWSFIWSSSYLQAPYCSPQFNKKLLHSLTPSESSLCDTQYEVDTAAKSKTFKEFRQTIVKILGNNCPLVEKHEGYVGLCIVVSTISLCDILLSISLAGKDKYFIHEWAHCFTTSSSSESFSTSYDQRQEGRQ